MNKQDVTHYLRYGLWANKTLIPPAVEEQSKQPLKQRLVGCDQFIVYRTGKSG